MRLDLVFVSVCMALIAGSAGAIAYSAFGFGAPSAMLTAIAVLALLSLYNLLSMRAAVRIALRRWTMARIHAPIAMSGGATIADAPSTLSGKTSRSGTGSCGNE